MYDLDLSCILTTTLHITNVAHANNKQTHMHKRQRYSCVISHIVTAPNFTAPNRCDGGKLFEAEVVLIRRGRRGVVGGRRGRGSD